MKIYQYFFTSLASKVGQCQAWGGVEHVSVHATVSTIAEFLYPAWGPVCIFTQRGTLVEKTELLQQNWVGKCGIFQPN